MFSVNSHPKTFSRQVRNITKWIILTVLQSIPRNTGAAFNFTKCPSSSELWATNAVDPTKVPRTFNMSMFAPEAPRSLKYYELAFHDWTQKPACPGAKCITSEKTWDRLHRQINDTFTIDCAGLPFHPALRFNLTQTPGALLGWWSDSLSPQHGWIPDTIVDFKVSADGSRYEYVLEFQCVEESNRVVFAGINFYAMYQNPGKEYIDAFLQLARERGLGVYMDSGEKVTIVNQTDCGQ
eukprot:m.8648 g.8648  ORF g.8648 m.8648 type:complete len:238 (-) comp6643_c0_seq2:335-1048(-)